MIEVEVENDPAINPLPAAVYRLGLYQHAHLFHHCTSALRVGGGFFSLVALHVIRALLLPEILPAAAMLGPSVAGSMFLPFAAGALALRGRVGAIREDEVGSVRISDEPEDLGPIFLEAVLHSSHLHTIMAVLQDVQHFSGAEGLQSSFWATYSLFTAHFGLLLPLVPEYIEFRRPSQPDGEFSQLFLHLLKPVE
jgi:hypothetical protein